MLSFVFIISLSSILKRSHGREEGSLLTNSWVENIGNRGFQWDIKANEDITIKSLDFNFNGCPYSKENSFTLYTKSGTHIGYQTTSSAWTYVCGGTVYCNGHDPTSSTADAGNCDVDISAGSTQAFYLKGADYTSTQFTSYKEDIDNLGNLFASDSYINVYSGTGMYGEWESDEGNAYRASVRIYYLYGEPTTSPTDSPTQSPIPTSEPTNKPTNKPNDSEFPCNDGCIIPIDFYNDDYCDCSNCEDEDLFTCQNCEADRDCDYVAESCGNWIKCMGDWSNKNSDNNDDNSDKSYGHGDHDLSNNNSNNNDTGNDTGLIIGLVCGAIGLLIIISIGIYFQNRNNKINNQVGLLSDTDKDKDYAPPNINVLTTQQE